VLQAVPHPGFASALLAEEAARFGLVDSTVAGYGMSIDQSKFTGTLSPRALQLAEDTLTAISPGEGTTLRR
jgi:hypothetical protein